MYDILDSVAMRFKLQQRMNRCIISTYVRPVQYKRTSAQAVKAWLDCRPLSDRVRIG